jgi:hypothetical protein
MPAWLFYMCCVTRQLFSCHSFSRLSTLAKWCFRFTSPFLLILAHSQLWRPGTIMVQPTTLVLSVLGEVILHLILFIILDTGNLAAVSRNLTHSYQTYSAMVEMSTVSPLTMLSGTWPSRPYISREVSDLTYASLIMQSSQRHLGQPERNICRPTPFFNSRTAPSPMLEDRVWGSVCLICQPASHSFLLNSPSTCALAPSMTMTLGTPSL